MLDIVAGYHCMQFVESYHCKQFQGKLMNQTWENGKKLSFGPDFGPLGLELGLIFFSCILLLVELSLSVNSKKTNKTNLRKWQKV